MRKLLPLVLFIFTSLFANDLFVETLDEQLTSDNLIVLRFRINNDGNPLKNAVLRYSLKKVPGKSISIENYYLGSASVSLHEVDSVNAYMDISLGDVPNGIFPDQSGYSVGIHYNDWSQRDKNADVSMPQSSSFTRAENVTLFADGMLVYGNESVRPANVKVKFTAFRPGADGIPSFVDVKNTGEQSVPANSLYASDSKKHRCLLLKDSLAVGEIVRVYLDSLSCDLAFYGNGELLLEYGNIPVDYIVWGAPGDLALEAQWNGLWDESSDFIKKFGEDAFGFVPCGDSLFYVRLDLEQNNSYAWQVYSEYESDSYEDYLPDAPPYALPDGVGIVLEKDQSMRFVWNRVPFAEQYRLVVLSAKDSSLVYQNVYASNAADVNLPEGEYLWGVQASNSQKQFKPMSVNQTDPIMRVFTPRQRLLLQYAKDLLNYDEFVRIGAPLDTIASSNGRKDTKLLNINWGEFADIRGWDTEHTEPDPVTRPLDEDEGYRCWAIAIQELNHYYTTKNGAHGDLTLDEIIANVKIHFDTTDANGMPRVAPLHGSVLAPFKLLVGGEEHEVIYGLQHALNIPKPQLIRTKEKYIQNGNWNTFELASDWVKILQNGNPIYISQCNRNTCSISDGKHAMIVDGYRVNFANAEYEFHFMNVDNYGTNHWRRFLDVNQWEYVEWYIPIEMPTDVALTDPDVHNDDDNDGIMNFDEKYRFDSDYQKKDTDGDEIDDKTEIHSYTIRERTSFPTNTFILPFLKQISGIVKETLADVDGDGFRAENDKDSDGDGLEDGHEDADHNGYVDAGETDPYTIDYFPQRTDEKIDVPKDIALYALDFLRINDGVDCRINANKKCSVASEYEGDAAVALGVGVPVTDVYAKGKVWMRNYSYAESIRYYGLPNQNYATDVQKGATFEHEVNLNANQWPYTIPRISTKSNSSQIDKIVKNGEQFTLTDGATFRSLKVEAGGTLLITSGEMIIDYLQLDSDAKLYFVTPGYETIVHVNKSIKWNAEIINADPALYAQGFKLYYYGTGTFDVAGRWGGTLIAPNAEIILGQNWNKVIYGQFLAKQIVVHQYATIQRVIFNPITLDVAFMEGRL